MLPAPMRPLSLAATALLLAASASHAQVYRTTGPDGRTIFTDRPPASATAPTGASAGADSSANGGSALPYELGQIARRYPVTLYTRADCAPCASARSLLTRRGVPFAERTVNNNADVNALKGLFGEASLPAMTVGQQQVKGYSEQAWTQYLDAAGYPQTSRLPGNYRQPAPTPLTDPQAAPARSTPTVTPIETTPAQTQADPPISPPITRDNPTGIRF